MTGSEMRPVAPGRQQVPHRSHVTGCVRGTPSSAGHTHGPGAGSERRRKCRTRNTRSVPVGGVSVGSVISHATRTPGGTTVGAPVPTSLEYHARQLGNAAI